MKILKRYKDANGNTVGYGISIEGSVDRVSLEQALALQNYIDNAFITSDGEYRAKSGCKIRTELLRISPQDIKVPLRKYKGRKCSAPHSYIIPRLIKDFSKKKKFVNVYNDLKYRYRIVNVLNDDALVCIAKTLYKDYKVQRCNYEAYIEEGMDARLLMELRKSAVFFIADGDDTYFYTGLKDCNTWQEVRQFRINFFKRINQDYEELDWQYYFLVIKLCGKYSKDFVFDFEDCFADGDWRKQTVIEDYKLGFYNAHMPEWLHCDEWLAD